MDLATLQSRVSAGHYATLEEFDHEASLIFRNCFKFNTKRSDIFQHAKRLQAVYKRWQRRYLDSERDEDGESEAEMNGRPAPKRRKGSRRHQRGRSSSRRSHHDDQEPRKRGRPKGSRNKPK